MSRRGGAQSAEQGCTRKQSARQGAAPAPRTGPSGHFGSRAGRRSAGRSTLHEANSTEQPPRKVIGRHGDSHLKCELDSEIAAAADGGGYRKSRLGDNLRAGRHDRVRANTGRKRKGAGSSAAQVLRSYHARKADRHEQSLTSSAVPRQCLGRTAMKMRPTCGMSAERELLTIGEKPLYRQAKRLR